MKAFHMSLMQKMQRRSTEDGRWSDWLQVLYPMQQQATFSLVESQDSNQHNKFTQQVKTMTPEAERFNGWAAMLGFVAAVGAYVTTGQIIPGIF